MNKINDLVAKLPQAPQVERVVPKTVDQQTALARGVMPSNPPAPHSEPLDTYKVPGNPGQFFVRKDW